MNLTHGYFDIAKLFTNSDDDLYIIPKFISYNSSNNGNL